MVILLLGRVAAADDTANEGWYCGVVASSAVSCGEYRCVPCVWQYDGMWMPVSGGASRSINWGVGGGMSGKLGRIAVHTGRVDHALVCTRHPLHPILYAFPLEI